MSQNPSLPKGDVQRWTAKRKAAVVVDLIRGKTTAADAARLHGLIRFRIRGQGSSPATSPASMDRWLVPPSFPALGPTG
jgi:hypothetical protein